MHVTPTFRHTFSVAPEDIDMLGHASNLAYVRWIQDVAVAHSQAVGLGIPEYQRLGAVFVVVRHEIDYLRPALRGERLEARTWIATVMAAKCHRVTEIAREADGKVLAKSITTWGFIQVASGRPRRIPDEVKAAFQASLSA